jgi:hypothetical protein
LIHSLEGPRVAAKLGWNRTAKLIKIERILEIIMIWKGEGMGEEEIDIGGVIQ